MPRLSQTPLVTKQPRLLERVKETGLETPDGAVFGFRPWPGKSKYLLLSALFGGNFYYVSKVIFAIAIFAPMSLQLAPPSRLIRYKTIKTNCDLSTSRIVPPYVRPLTRSHFEPS